MSLGVRLTNPRERGLVSEAAFERLRPGMAHGDESELAADPRFRRKAWTVIGCALAAFWLLAAGALALIFGAR